MWTCFEFISSIYLSCVLIDHMENCVSFGVPVYTFTNPLSTQFACHNLQEIHFDWLLDEYYEVLRHGCNKIIKNFNQNWRKKSLVFEILYSQL